MLSYRHAFHAGNFADVMKHLILVNTVEYLCKKDTPFLYVDTHAGAGRYFTNDEMAKKTNEAQAGVGALNFNALPGSCAAYARLVQPLLQQETYPGSPQIAASLMRSQDRLCLFERHSTDFPKLKSLFNGDRRVKVDASDGHMAIKALLPPPEKRALVLIDPSYELKTEYRQAAASMILGFRCMPQALLLLWYPVVRRQTVDELITKLRQSPLKNLWQFELGIEPDNNDYGMTASGILAVNPPWILPDQLQEAMPALLHQLAADQGFFHIRQLIGE